MSFGIVLCSCGSKMRELVGADGRRFVTHLKWDELEGKERSRRSVQKANEQTGG